MHRKSNAGDSRGEFLNYTYMLKCSDGTLYTGWTNDLEKRVEAHNSGKGAKYTKARRPVGLAYYEEFETKEQAMKREYAIKQLGRKEKQKLIAGKKVKLSAKRSRSLHLTAEIDLTGMLFPTIIFSVQAVDGYWIWNWI